MIAVAAGRTADVFDLGDGRVLRRYRAPGQDCEVEAELMRHLWEAGFPVPEVHAAEGTDLVLTRVEGPTLAEAGRSGAIGPREVGSALAELHDLLDAVPPPPMVTRHPSADGRRTPRVVHLDLHPENVLLASTGPVVIDWTNSAVGAGGLDRAMTALILAEVVLASDPQTGAAVRAALERFLEAAGRPADGHLQAAVAHRQSDPTLSAREVGRLGWAARLVGQSPEPGLRPDDIG